MAYIAPNSTIQLFKDIKLSPDSEDTFYFDNKSIQNTFFTQHVYATFSGNSYTRLKRNTIKIGGVMANLYNCNYMRFINTSFENKWFYAFITKVDYVNNETVEIDYIIDEIQTWLFSPDVGYDQCFIERQHDRYDTLLANYIPENLNVGELICEKTSRYALQSDRGFNIGMLVSAFPDGTRISGGMCYGIFTGLGMYGDNFTNILNKINSYTDPSNIVLIFMYPALVGSVSIDAGQELQPFVLQDTLHTNPNFTTVDSYTPKNKKLFTYPYNYVRIYSAGQYRDYRWEYWNKGVDVVIGDFHVHLTYMPPVTSACVPYRYKGEVEAYSDGLTISNFPQCAWNDDTYKAWYAQHKATVAASLMSSIATTAVGATTALATGSFFGGSMAVNGLTQTATTLAELEDKTNAPPTVHAANLSDNMLAATLQYDFEAKQMCVKSEIAKIIDDYFELYGYKQDKIAYPDIKTRENWTYIKTIGCGLHGDLPADSINEIEKRFNSGIRFWVNPLRLGDYSMSNLPLGAEP